ncbi:hypothetical protein [Geochorda subterranea]|uniref:Uncharacterized protein n=1 Tax=Geochorda subterranea TaxID=3109564 RepID=A0ABZ1BRZ7_9FIRM|nr:hypothetical protein [Limnochorda sp. LNt]WRP15241.1 hypothetical protein VLY81_03470 [Limnochorda sp. LNt]
MKRAAVPVVVHALLAVAARAAEDEGPKVVLPILSAAPPGQVELGEGVDLAGTTAVAVVAVDAAGQWWLVVSFGRLEAGQWAARANLWFLLPSWLRPLPGG